jgi:hypothetical protein
LPRHCPWRFASSLTTKANRATASQSLVFQTVWIC